MRRFSILPYTAILLLYTPSVVVAQDNAGAGNLLHRTGWIRFDIIAGRITAHRIQTKDRKTASLDRPEVGLKETLFVANEQSGPIVRFEHADSNEYIRVEVSAGSNLKIQRGPSGPRNGPQLDFVQALNGDSRLTLTNRESTRAVQAASFWHLAMAQPQLCRDYLIPTLECLRADWCLWEMTQSFEHELVDLTRHRRVPTPHRFLELVRRLGDDEFRRRQESDREIREMGPALISYLDQLDPQTLNAEQRFRVRKIRQSFETWQIDTPTRAATRLVGDASVWLSLLAKNDESLRRTASVQLRRICQQQLEFNPRAKRQVRTAQIQRIHDQLGLR